MAWLAGYKYRKKITVTNKVNAYPTMQTIGFSSGGDVHCQGLCQTDFGDVRFTDSDAITELKYWLEVKTDSNSAVFWPKSAATAATTQYMYFGKAGDTTTSSGTDTFTFFDDFPGVAVGAAWTSTGGVFSVASSILTVQDEANAFSYVMTNADYGTNTAFRCKVKNDRYEENLSYVTSFGYLDFASNCCEAQAQCDEAGSAYNHAFMNWKQGGADAMQYTQLSGWSANVYHTIDCIRNSTTSCIYRIDNANEVTSTLGIPNINLPICIMARDLLGAGHLVSSNTDWVLVRPYTATEPTFAWGSLESLAKGGISRLMAGGLI
jgi:hypothetical protein